MYINVVNVKKRYGEAGNYVQVLNNITTTIEKGQLCAILGPSGSGKSTLLNVIGGLDSVDSGSIQIDGNEITNLKPGDLLDYRRDTLGFVFQFYNLIPNLTVRENIEVCRYLSPAPLKLDDLLQTLGLMNQQNKFPAQLSGGQQQRCAIARALIKNPKLLLCDEPTGALDSKTAKEILMLLETINVKYGTTMLIVTHNDVLKKMVDKVISIRDGMIDKECQNQTRISAVDLEL